MKELLKKLPWIDKETREVVLPFAIVLIPMVTGVAKETYSYLPVVWQIYLCLLWLEVLAIATFLICVAIQYLKRVIVFKHPLNIVKAYLSAIMCLGIASLIGLGIVPMIRNLISSF